MLGQTTKYLLNPCFIAAGNLNGTLTWTLIFINKAEIVHLSSQIKLPETKSKKIHLTSVQKHLEFNLLFFFRKHYFKSSTCIWLIKLCRRASKRVQSFPHLLVESWPSGQSSGLWVSDRKWAPEAPPSVDLRREVRMGGSGEDSFDCRTLKMQHSQQTWHFHLHTEAKGYHLFLSGPLWAVMSWMVWQVSQKTCSARMGQRGTFSLTGGSKYFLTGNKTQLLLTTIQHLY